MQGVERPESCKMRRTRTLARRERGKENLQPAMPGTTTMGPVLDSLDDPLAEERSQENIVARHVDPLDTPHISARKRKVDRAPEGRLGTTQGEEHPAEGHHMGTHLHVGQISRSRRRQSGNREENPERKKNDEGRRKRRRSRDREDQKDDEPKAEFNGKLMTLEVYTMKRCFNFLHMYAGVKDPLGKAIEEEAKRHRMKVSVYLGVLLREREWC